MWELRLMRGGYVMLNNFRENVNFLIHCSIFRSNKEKFKIKIRGHL